MSLPRETKRLLMLMGHNEHRATILSNRPLPASTSDDDRKDADNCRRIAMDNIVRTEMGPGSPIDNLANRRKP